ncbi:protein FAM53A-like [Elysia marginata]|uniref:Protein FAM53A-like n=1 Tax=Elysia marginata TaxID=1093978 RepID=A0AAV4HZJ9_9GAST|nr:protein FAM53A-like [Elysia marginata]
MTFEKYLWIVKRGGVIKFRPPFKAKCTRPSFSKVGYENTTKSVNQRQTSLAVKGKNVWALTLESERPDRQSQEFASSDLVPRPPTLRPVSEKVPPLAVQIPAACCRHKKLRQACFFCESAPGTPTAPPKKKHCRSLSVPPDSGFGNIPAGLAGKELSGRLWKPIAVIPLSNSSSASGGTTSPCELGKSQQALQSRLTTTANLSSTHPALGESGGRGSSWLPNLLGSELQHVPPSASAASSDSGNFTTSDFQTPPGSPVPTAATRPASASSDTASSFSSLGSAWLDFTSGGAGGTSSRAFRGARALQNRSLSCEDRISGSSSSTSPYTSAAATNTTSMPCVHAGVLGSMEACYPTSCLPLSGASRCRSGSQDSSSGDRAAMACTGSIPRCHSQPCVLHHRRCGKKRRRNCDRPTLNFNKMTETAYMRGDHRRPEPWTPPVFINQPSVASHSKHYEVCGGGNGNTSSGSSRLSFVLNPIASSPLDSDFPLVDTALMPSGGHDLRQAASIALPLTPPDQASPTFPLARSASNSIKHSREEEEEEEEDEEDHDHRNCRCHDSRTDDGVGLVFPMVDLDLEEIENH